MNEEQKTQLFDYKCKHVSPSACFGLLCAFCFLHLLLCQYVLPLSSSGSLMKELNRSGKWYVLPEMEYQIRGERFRPDLTFVSEDTVEILEVSVPFATSSAYLAEGTKNKEMKYSRPSFLEAVRRRYPRREIRVRGMIVGARGEIPSTLKSHLQDLAILSSTTRLQCSAICGSQSSPLDRQCKNY